MFGFRRARQKIHELEASLSPLQIERLIRGGAREFRIGEVLKAQPAKRFKAHDLRDGGHLFEAIEPADTLLICLGDRVHRVMQPISVILQSLDERRHDVLFLKDPRRAHFDTGSPGWGETFGELIRSLRRFIRDRGYRSTVTMGGSMGGLPALRAGRLLQADRAISIGGRFAIHTARFRDRESEVEAFDPLCHCIASRCESIAVYRIGNEEDAVDAQRLARIIPSLTTLPMPGAQHNIVRDLFKLGRLDEFLAEMMDLSRPPDPQRIAAMLPGDLLSD